MGEPQRTQLQPFSVRFKNVVIYSVGIFSFILTTERSEV
jgi:hypothetical protein